MEDDSNSILRPLLKRTSSSTSPKEFVESPPKKAKSNNPEISDESSDETDLQENTFSDAEYTKVMPQLFAKIKEHKELYLPNWGNSSVGLSPLFELHENCDTRPLDKLEKQNIKIVLWQQIAQEINISVDVCKKMWNHTKDILNGRKSSSVAERKQIAKQLGVIRYLISENKIYSTTMQFKSTRNKPLKTESLNRLRQENITERQLDIMVLLQEIQKHPQIYNILDPDYNFLIQERKEIWNEISNKLQIDVFRCKTVWGVLKTAFFELLSIGSSLSKMRHMRFVEGIYKEIINKSLPDYDNKDFIEDIATIKNLIQVIKDSYSGSGELMWNDVARNMFEPGKKYEKIWNYLLETQQEIHRRKQNNQSYPKWPFEKDLESIILKSSNDIQRLKTGEITEKIKSDTEVDFKRSLIKVVRENFPQFYDPDLKSTTISRLKDLWQICAGLLNRGVRECKTDWRKLTSTFRDMLLIKSNLGNNIQWEYESDMEWMIPYCSSTRICEATNHPRIYVDAAKEPATKVAQTSAVSVNKPSVEEKSTPGLSSIPTTSYPNQTPPARFSSSLKSNSPASSMPTTSYPNQTPPARFSSSLKSNSPASSIPTTPVQTHPAPVVKILNRLPRASTVTKYVNVSNNNVTNVIYSGESIQ